MSNVQLYRELLVAAHIARKLRKINEDLESAGVIVKDLFREIADLNEVLADWIPEPTDYEVKCFSFPAIYFQRHDTARVSCLSFFTTCNRKVYSDE